ESWQVGRRSGRRTRAVWNGGQNCRCRREASRPRVFGIRIVGVRRIYPKNAVVSRQCGKKAMSNGSVKHILLFCEKAMLLPESSNSKPVTTSEAIVFSFWMAGLRVRQRQ